MKVSDLLYGEVNESMIFIEVLYKPLWESLQSVFCIV